MTGKHHLSRQCQDEYLRKSVKAFRNNSFTQLYIQALRWRVFFQQYWLPEGQFPPMTQIRFPGAWEVDDPTDSDTEVVRPGASTNEDIPECRDGLRVDEEDEDNTPMINDVVNLKKGIIKTSQMEKPAYTILLVGETGVGKSSVLEFIANVLYGNNIDHYDFTLLDHSNEQGGSGNQSQTNSARLYNLWSKDGTLVRILDTPGLADTRGLHQDEIHKRNIATQIEMHVESVTAVLILANGTVPRITVGTDYALSTLSAIFPHTLANNIAFMFTNVSSPLSWNFSQDTIPEVLNHAPQYLLDNPIALQSKYLKLRDDPNRRRVRTELKRAVKDGEKKALETLVDFFDWMDGLKPQPTKDILTLFEKSQTIEAKIANTLAQMDQAAAKRAEIDRHLRAAERNSADMNAFSNFQNTVNIPFWIQKPTTTHNTVCTQTDCYSNCHIDCQLDYSLDPKNLKSCAAMRNEKCQKCNHTVLYHQHHRSTWEKEINEKVTVDEVVKQKWEAAKNGKEKVEAMIDAGLKVANRLDQIIDDATNELAQLAEDYSRLSLSGSFSAQMEKAVTLLEQRYRGMEEQGIDQGQLQKVKGALDNMKKKLALLRTVKRKTWTERSNEVTSKVRLFFRLV